MRKAIFHTIFLACTLAVFSPGCNDAMERGNDDPELPPPIRFDLDSILKRGKIILLTENSATSYYNYRGQILGYDYEMVKAFAKHLGVKLEVRLLDDVDVMFEMLNKGQGDLIANNITVTKARKKLVSFAEPVCQTRQVLVQRKYAPNRPDSLFELVDDTLELAGKEIWVHHYSVFYDRLNELGKRLPVAPVIHEAPGEISTDDLIRLTAEQQVLYTITDENLAVIESDDYPELDMNFAISNEQDIAWAVRSNARKLLDTLNHWLASGRTQRLQKRMYSKYFDKAKRRNTPDYFVMPSISGSAISAYDSLMKVCAKECDWDWRLLSALVFVESRFNPNAKSWSGAFGLMQLMPETAMKFGCDTTQYEEANIRAGVKYIRYLERMWKDKIPDKKERVKFVLASYNSGPGHIMDARKIAESLGLKDSVWSENVENCIIMKRQEKYYTMEGVKHGYFHGGQTFSHVRKILSVYDYYLTLKLD